MAVLTIVAYRGILDDHANSASATSASKLASAGGANKHDTLAGGASLDLLGLIVVVQYGTALLSDKFYWFLAVLPFWGGYRLYSTFSGAKQGLMGGGGGGYGMPNSRDVGGGEGSAISGDAVEERRRKRAERRRMKRG